MLQVLLTLLPWCKEVDMVYSQLPLRQTDSGPAPTVRLGGRWSKWLKYGRDQLHVSALEVSALTRCPLRGSWLYRMWHLDPKEEYSMQELAWSASADKLNSRFYQLKLIRVILNVVGSKLECYPNSSALRELHNIPYISCNWPHTVVCMPLLPSVDKIHSDTQILCWRWAEQSGKFYKYLTCPIPWKYPGPRGFLSPQRGKRREWKKWREKTSGCGRCESHYHTTIGVNYTSQDQLTSNQ